MNVLRGLALLLVLQAAGELLRHGPAVVALAWPMWQRRLNNRAQAS